MIDWSREIETVDGKPLVYLPERNTGENDFPRWVESPDNSYITRFYSDCGKPWNPRNPDLRNVAQPAVFPTPDERAVAPKLVARMVGLAKEMASQPGPEPRFIERARAILAALEPVDPDLLVARDVVECTVHWSPSTDKNIQSGKNDNTAEMKIALAAIKRGRQLEKEGK